MYASCLYSSGNGEHDGGEGPVSLIKTYRGQLVETTNREDHDCLGIKMSGGNIFILADIISDDMAEYGNYLTIKYFTSIVEISEDNLPLELAKMLMGVGEGIYELVYSETTGYLWTTEELKVGGHDLLQELYSFRGKYLHMEISFSKSIES